MLCERDVLRHLARGHHRQPELHVHRRFFAGRRHVQVEIDLRAGADQPARIRGKHVGGLADRVLVEEEAGWIVFVFDHVRRRVVNDLVRADVDGPRFDGRHVHVFLESWIDDDVDELVGTASLEHVRLRHPDHDGRLNVPRIEIAELARRRHVGGIALGCALVHPLHDRVDLLVRERWIVLVLLDADVLVDEPRRHLAGRDLGLDRARPRTRVLVGEKRHRRHHARPMAGLTRSLQDRRDVFCERHLAITGAGRRILRAHG